MTPASNDSVHVSLIADQNGEDHIALELADSQVVLLTTSQARALATSLITAVNRAEVKASLRVSTNLWRRAEDGEQHLAMVR